jgi:tRNA U34 2-thiouridine synthase MnmA/TrmU
MRPVVASQVLLPVGDLHKTAVRKLAADAGLCTADAKESMGICFIGKRSMAGACVCV